LAEQLERLMPRITLVVMVVVCFLVMADYFIVGGLGGTALGQWNITTLQALQTRSGPIVTLVMTISLLQLYFRRLKSKEGALVRKALLFFVGLGITVFAGFTWSPTSMQYTFLARLLVQSTLESGTFWLGIVYVVAIVKGYLVRSWEGLVLVIPGMLEVWGQGMLGNVLLPQLGDLGIWIMRYPSVGGNISLALSSNIGAIAIAARVLTGHQKLRAAR